MNKNNCNLFVSRKKTSDPYSYIFLLFLDITWQIMQQYPFSFEYPFIEYPFFEYPHML